MTTRDVIDRLCRSPKGITSARVDKAKAFAARFNVEWQDVLAAMTDAQRQAVTNAKART